MRRARTGPTIISGRRFRNRVAARRISRSAFTRPLWHVHVPARQPPRPLPPVVRSPAITRFSNTARRTENAAAARRAFYRWVVTVRGDIRYSPPPIVIVTEETRPRLRYSREYPERSEEAIGFSTMCFFFFLCVCVHFFGKMFRKFI